MSPRERRPRKGRTSKKNTKEENPDSIPAVYMGGGPSYT